MKKWRKKWTREKIIRKIQYRHSKGWPLNWQYVSDHSRGLTAATVPYFGNWQKAIEAAGLNYSKIRKTLPANTWTRKRIKEKILARKKAGLPLNEDYVRRDCASLRCAADRYFGSWKEAIESCGIKYRIVRLIAPNGFWTKRRVVATIRKRKRNRLPLNVQAVRKDVPTLVSAAIRVHGSWKRAVEAAGISYNRVRVYRSWSKKAVIRTLRARIKEGKRIDRTALKGKDGALLHATRSFFGSWEKAVLAMGGKPNDFRQRQQWTDKRVLGSLCNLIKGGGSVDAGTLKKHHRALYHAINTRFGGLRKALLRLNLDWRQYLKYDLPLDHWVAKLNDQEFRKMVKQIEKMINFERASGMKK